MKTKAIRSLLFALIIIAMGIVNMIVFRSEFPMLWLVTLLASIVVLILFPYSKFFQIKKS